MSSPTIYIVYALRSLFEDSAVRCTTAHLRAKQSELSFARRLSHDFRCNYAICHSMNVHVVFNLHLCFKLCREV